MPHLTLTFFGSFQAALDGQPIGFTSRRGKALLAYLVIESNRPHSRETLAGLLWPDELAAIGFQNLRRTLSDLRHAVGEGVMQITPHAVQFNKACEYSTDVADFMALMQGIYAHTKAHRRGEACPVCLQELQRAVALYRGDFLADVLIDDSAVLYEWIMLTREDFRLRAIRAIGALCEHHALIGETDALASMARRLIALDPWHEVAHRHLMRVLAWNGQRASALAHYAAFSRRLFEEIGARPEIATSELAQQIECDSLLASTPWAASA